MKQSVIGIVTDPSTSTIILVKRRDVPIWVFPGGGIDEGETPEEAVIREVLEETGLHVRIKRKTGEYSPINKLTSLTHVFECEPVSGRKELTEETCGIEEFRLAALPASFFFIHRSWLDDALLNKPHPIKRALSQVTYWGVAKYFMQHPILVARALLARLGMPLNSRRKRD